MPIYKERKSKTQKHLSNHLPKFFKRTYNNSYYLRRDHTSTAHVVTIKPTGVNTKTLVDGVVINEYISE